MKCDNYIFQKTHHGVGPPDDYSAGYCSKGHWEGVPLLINYESTTPPDLDIWDDCTDFSPIPGLPAFKKLLVFSKNNCQNT